jgi:hypothetical protein
MKALVHENRVVQVEENEFPVHPSMQWITCPDEVVAGYTYENGVFTAPVVEPEPAPVIMSVGPLQLRRALREVGMYAAVVAYVEAADEEIQEAWEYATEYRRDDPLFPVVQTAMELTDEDVDNLFALAATK